MASNNILIEASEVWDYFHNNKSDLINSMHMIAECAEYGIEIYLTEKEDLPEIIVNADDVQVYCELTVRSKDCETTVKNIYEDYLTEKAISKLLNSEADIEQINEEELREMEIEQREDEIDTAIWDVLSVVLDNGTYYLDETNEICEDVKEHLLEYLYRKWGLEIYRPMVIEFDDGSEEYKEYPYEYLEFEHKDNPIYK